MTIMRYHRAIATTRRLHEQIFLKVKRNIDQTHLDGEPNAKAMHCRIR